MVEVKPEIASDNFNVFIRPVFDQRLCIISSTLAPLSEYLE
jgi:hypothetical protein